MDRELELEKLKLEKIRVAAARAEQEFMIKQRNSEIKKLQDNIQNQLKRESELDNLIQEAQKQLSSQAPQ